MTRPTSASGLLRPPHPPVWGLHSPGVTVSRSCSPRTAHHLNSDDDDDGGGGSGDVGGMFSLLLLRRR